MTQPARTLTDADVEAIADAVADRLRGRVPVSEAPANEVPPKRRRKRDLSHVVPTDMDYALAAQVQRRLGIVPKRR